MHPFTIAEVAHILKCHLADSTKISGVFVDSRLLQKGGLFFALPGQKMDGHAFLKEVSEKKASGAVVHQTYSGPDFNLPLIRVADTLQALQNFARHVLDRFCAKIVAVTGSVGKTTTKDFIATLLSTRYRVASTPANNNSQIGLPLSILNHMKGDETAIVLEMGMTHPGNIKKLLEIAPPDIAVITAVSLVHAVNFESLDQITLAKAEILSHPKTSLGIIHRGIAGFSQIVANATCPILSFGVSDAKANYTAILNNGSTVILRDGSEIIELDALPIPGQHNLHNFLASVAVARGLGVAWEDITSLAKTLRLPERRLEVVEKYGISFINDSYNASVLSVKAALDCLPVPKPGGRKIAILGSMMELGKFSRDCHWEIADYALSRTDMMLCLGEECLPIEECWKKAGRPVYFFQNKTEIVKKLQTVLQNGDVVLIKGSRSNEMWKILEEYKT